MSNHRFAQERGSYRYEGTGYIFSIQSYRDGFGIIVKNSGDGTHLKYFCGLEGYPDHVVWRVSWPHDWNEIYLPGPDRKLKDIIHDFLVAYEDGKSTEVIFGQ